MKYPGSVFKHFFECGLATKRLNHSILLHRAEITRLQAYLTNLLHRPLLQDRIAYVDVRDQQFIEADSPTITGEITGRTSFTSPQSEVAQVGALQAKTTKNPIFRRVSHSTARTDLADESLCKHRPDRRCDQGGFNLHIDQSNQSSNRVLGMERRKDFVA